MASVAKRRRRYLERNRDDRENDRIHSLIGGPRSNNGNNGWTSNGNRYRNAGYMENSNSNDNNNNNNNNSKIAPPPPPPFYPPMPSKNDSQKLRFIYLFIIYILFVFVD